MPVVAPSVAAIEADAAASAAAVAAAAEYKTSVSGPTTTTTTATINTGTVPTANLITTTESTTTTNTNTNTTNTNTTSTTAIVVVADDFGMSKARNEGIARAICNGVVTATSIVANAPAADAALALAREKGFLGAVGLHLNLTEGRPVAEPTVVPSLLAPPPAPAESFTATTNGDTTAYGCGSTNVVMRGKGNLRAACNAAAAATAAATTNAQGCPVVIGHHSVVDPAEAAIEARAQLDWYTARVGVPPPYVDGHQHCHVIPALVSTLAAEFQRAGVQRVRIPAEPGAAMALCPTCSRVTSEAEAARSVFAEAGLSATQGFVGLSLCGLAYGVDECMAAVCAQIARPGVSSIEIMTHPGLCSASDDAWDAFDAAPARERELKVLCDPQLRLQLEALPARLARHA